MATSDVAFVVPGDLDLPTGGYAYARQILARLPAHGVPVRHFPIPGSFPFPTPHDLDVTAATLASTPPGTVLLIDGLAYGAMPADLISRLGRTVVALVHHPLALESGLDRATAAQLLQSEREALALAAHVIASSPTTARTLSADYGVPAARLTIAEPGVDRARRASGTGTPLQILSVGAVVKRKGYDVLLTALEPYRGLPWRLDIVGATDRDWAFTAQITSEIASRGLADQVTLRGAVASDVLDDLYDRADLFVLASRYEGYGMVLAEAMVRGLAIVCTTGGAAAETVPDGAALKVEPDNARALMWQLGRAIEDDKLRAKIAAAAWSAVPALPTWDDTARKIATAIAKVTP